jgi:hypothetical protein
MGWVIEDLTKSELQQSWWTVMLDIQKVPLQGSYSVPALPSPKRLRAGRRVCFGVLLHPLKGTLSREKVIL